MDAEELDLTYQRLLVTLQRLLELPATDLREAMNQSAQFVVEALKADKVDAFLYDPSKNSLRAMGTSNTQLGRLQIAQGLDFMPIANGGSTVEVYVTGRPHITGHADQVPHEVPGIIDTLGVRSHIAVPLDVAGERRGVLSVQSQTPEFFSADDLRFLQAVSRWVGAVGHRAELSEAITAAALERGRRAVAEELVTVLAHDLRNHLGPLVGRIEVIRMRAVREGRSKDVRDAELGRLSVNRITRLVTDLLDVGRIEQGIFSLHPSPVDLVTLAQETAQALGSAEIPIEVNGPPELVLVADPERLRQALENLVGNAIKHSPAGKAVVLALRTEVQPDAKAHAILEVRDQGPGVPPEVLPYVFERFVKGSSSQGLGLGLYLASQIAAAHGGTLTVEALPGNGATFRLTLPVLEGSDRCP